MSELIDLIRKYQAGKSWDERKESATEIHRELTPYLRGFIRPQCRANDVDDLQQESMVGIFKGLPKFRGESNAGAWAFCYGVARNKLGDYWRRIKARPVVPMDPEDLLRAIDVTQEESPLTSEQRERLQDAMELLRNTSAKCFDFLWLRYIQGWSHAEVATAYGLSSDAARVRGSRCLELARTLVRIGD